MLKPTCIQCLLPLKQLFLHNSFFCSNEANHKVMWGVIQGQGRLGLCIKDPRQINTFLRATKEAAIAICPIPLNVSLGKFTVSRNPISYELVDVEEIPEPEQAHDNEEDDTNFAFNNVWGFLSQGHTINQRKGHTLKVRIAGQGLPLIPIYTPGANKHDRCPACNTGMLAHHRKTFGYFECTDCNAVFRHPTTPDVAP